MGWSAAQAAATGQCSGTRSLVSTRVPLVLFCCLLCVGWPTDVSAAPADQEPATAEIDLRKSFTRVRSPGRQPSRQGAGPVGGLTPGSPEVSRRSARRPADAVADALGERLVSSGSLHLPLADGRQHVLEGELTPVLDTAAGRHVIIDAGRTMDVDAALEISRSWPGYAVAQPPPGTGLRGLIGSVLDAAGYELVERARPLIFGRGVTVRLTPDYLVQRYPRDLTQGEIRAISVVEPTEAFPPELRELAGGHRVRLVELAADGTPAGADRAPWRDPAGRVTTIESGSLPRILTEVAAALGRETAAEAASGEGQPLAAVGELLRRAGIEAIGPTVELYRPSAAGGRGRFVISVPGWLAENDGRRLLITGASPPLLVRLYLTREGIDIFEYRLR